MLFAVIASAPKIQGDELPTFRGGLEIKHEFEGGIIKIHTFYNTDYAEGQWKITDNKNVDIWLFVDEQPKGTTILVEHMHADCMICSNRTEINGIRQDTMDDKLHTGPQEGFYVSPIYPYNEVFAVEGYTQYLLSIWGYMWGNFGWMSGGEDRLDEENLQRLGAKGSEFAIVFDLLIRHEGEQFYHTISFMDDFIVYFDGGFQENPGSQAEFEIVAIYPYREYAWIFWPGLIVAMITGFWGRYRNENQKTAWPLAVICIVGIIILAAGTFCYFYPVSIEVPVVPQ